MTAPALAAVATLEKLMGEPLTGRARDRAASILDGVSSEVRAVAGRAWPDGAPELAVTTTLRAAERAYHNPGQLSTERLGEASRGYGDNASSDGVYLTAGERDAIRSLVDSGGVVSVPTERDVVVSDAARQLSTGEGVG